MSFEIDSVTLAVRDLPGVAAFYRDAIGLSETFRDGISAQLGVSGRPLLRLVTEPGLRPGAPSEAGLFHTAFLLPDRAAVGRWLRHAAALGLPIDGAADHRVSEAVYLADPEGNGIEIYADKPRAVWPWKAGQLEMSNDRLDLAALRALVAGPWTGMPAGTTIGHVHLQVGDLAAAEPFYQEQLGLAVTMRRPQALFLAADGYHHQLAVNTWRSSRAGPRDPARAGLREVAIRGGAERATLRDPWGTQFNLTGVQA